MIVTNSYGRRLATESFIVTSTPVDIVELDVKVKSSVTLSIEHSSPVERFSNQTVTLQVEDKLSRKGELADITISATFTDGTRMLLVIPNRDITLTSHNTSVATLENNYVIAVNEGFTEIGANWTACGQTIALGSTVVQFEKKQVPCFKEAIYRIELLENVPVGKILQLEIDVNLDDVEDAGIEFEPLLVSENLQFNVDRTTGLVTTVQTLDRETETAYELRVRVTDKAQREALRKLNTNENTSTSGDGAFLGSTVTECVATIFITVSDVNDNSPECSPVEVPQISQLEKVGFQVAVAQARDIDEGTNAALTYTIVDGDPNERFRIHSTSGVIVIANNLSTDLTQYALQVEARDGGNKVDTCFVTVTTYSPSWQVCVPAVGISETRFGDIKSDFEKRMGEIYDLDIFITQYSEEQGDSGETR